MFTLPKISLVILSVLILAANSGTALADLPDDVQIKYYIHEDDTDPDSPIVFKVLLLMEAKDSDSNSVGWSIKEAEFRQPNADPDPDTVWIDTSVDVDTPDDLLAFLSTPSETRAYNYLVRSGIAKRVTERMVDAADTQSAPP